jgi:hypothetical protein
VIAAVAGQTHPHRMTHRFRVPPHTFSYLARRVQMAVHLLAIDVVETQSGATVPRVGQHGRGRTRQ